MKKYLVALSLLILSLNSRGQTMGFGDMVDLVRLSVGQVDNILIATGKYRLNDKREVNGQIISKYQSINKDKKVIKGETLVTGSFRTTSDGTLLRTVTYYTVYPKYIQSLMKQITHYGYRLTFRGADPTRIIYIYDNALNHVTVSMLADHSNNSIEIRQKDADLEP